VLLIEASYDRYTLEFCRVRKALGETTFSIEPYDRVV
jgi:hypothetical protein